MTSDSVRFLQSLRSNAEAREAYQKWLADPMTRQVLTAMQEKGLPTLIARIDGYVAAQAHGYAAGRADLILELQALDQEPAEDPNNFADVP